MLSVLSIAATGLYAATSKLNVTAGNIANAETSGYRASRVDLAGSPSGVAADSVTLSDAAAGLDADGQPASNVDLAKESVDLILEKHLYTANAKVLKAGDQMLGTLLDVLAK